MKKAFHIFLFTFILPFVVVAQQDGGDYDPNGFNKFYYPDGSLSSEGYLRDGKPDGYWKTYYPNGTLKSEGNRKNFELDSTWVFYNEMGVKTLEMEYENGEKHGLQKTYDDDGNLKRTESFEAGVKQGLTKYFYEDGSLWKTVPYKNGKESGTGYEYAQSDGRIISITEYKNGYVNDDENINRIDKFGQKQGMWKEFYPDTTLKWSGRFRNDKRHGYFKEYDEEGNLLTTKKYEDGVLIPDPAELAKLDIKQEFYPNAKKKFVGSYKKETPEGVHRFYSEEGEVVNSKIYRNGVLIGEGIYNEEGVKVGKWREYYETGELKAEGKYENGVRVGEWKFYYKDGTLEQKGVYKGGRPDGEWKWFHPNGETWREEVFYRGVEDGLAIEYSDTGTVVAKGNYIEGEKEGDWIYQMNDHKEVGSYRNGLMHGEWKHYYGNGQLKFKGEYVEGREEGKHTYYHKNGKVSMEGRYILGNKQGVWKKYDEEGTESIAITYEDGKEVKIDGVKIKPETEQ